MKNEHYLNQNELEVSNTNHGNKQDIFDIMLDTLNDFTNENYKQDIAELLQQANRGELI